ncbi:hypothetical protein Q6267_27800, partial [Klebsiella pneumoniae]|nr:hypothetical protein [Klebsiella pneumoniae]
LGSRFKDSGINTPKPLIDVLGFPMIVWAMKSVETLHFTQKIFITLRQHNVEFNLDKVLLEHYPESTIIELDEVTEGQLSTVLCSREL